MMMEEEAMGHSLSLVLSRGQAVICIKTED
jgi:hypothetical protein